MNKQWRIAFISDGKVYIRYVDGGNLADSLKEFLDKRQGSDELAGLESLEIHEVEWA